MMAPVSLVLTHSDLLRPMQQLIPNEQHTSPDLMVNFSIVPQTFFLVSSTLLCDQPDSSTII